MKPLKKLKFWRAGIVFLVIVFLGIVIPVEYQKVIMQKELLEDISAISDRKVRSITLKKGRAPWREGKCLTINDVETIQFVLKSLKKVNNKNRLPSKNPIELEFQLVVEIVGEKSVDILGIVFTPYPNDAYIQRNNWTKSHSRMGQAELHWPGIGLWLNKKLEESQNTCRREIQK